MESNLEGPTKKVVITGLPNALVTTTKTLALFYCRSGCSQSNIMSGLASLGLTGKDLNWDKGWKPQARPVFTAHHETLILIAESDLANGRRFSAADKACYKDALFRRAMSWVTRHKILYGILSCVLQAASLFCSLLLCAQEMKTVNAFLLSQKVPPIPDLIARQ